MPLPSYQTGRSVEVFQHRFARHVQEASLCLTHDPFFFVGEFSKLKDRNSKLMLEVSERLNFMGYAYESVDEALKTFFGISSAMKEHVRRGEGAAVGLALEHLKAAMQVRFYTEAMYVQMARIVGVAKAVSGKQTIKCFEPQGCLRVRHELLSHPETNPGGPILNRHFRIRSLELGGPVIKNKRDPGEPPFPADRGLEANLAEFDGFWERWMELIMTTPEAPDGQGPQ